MNPFDRNALKTPFEDRKPWEGVTPSTYRKSADQKPISTDEVAAEEYARRLAACSEQPTCGPKHDDPDVAYLWLKASAQKGIKCHVAIMSELYNVAKDVVEMIYREVGGHIRRDIDRVDLVVGDCRLTALPAHPNHLRGRKFTHLELFGISYMPKSLVEELKTAFCGVLCNEN